MLVKPTSLKILDIQQSRVKLTFAYGPSPIEFFIRGAITWHRGGVPGFVLLGGQDVQNGHIYLFEDCEFIDIEDRYHKEKERFIGLSGFMRNAWTQYGCYEYYWQDADKKWHIRQTIRLDNDLTLKGIGRSGPIFMAARFKDTERADDLIAEYISKQKMLGSKESDLMAHLGTGNKDSAGRHALRCLLWSFEFDQPTIIRKEIKLIPLPWTKGQE